MDLRERLVALPPELYNHIFDLTFTAKGGIRKIWYDRMNKIGYKPPKLLQVSSVTRAKFARCYFGEGSIFELDNRYSLDRWGRCLDQAYVKLITTTVRCLVPFGIAHATQRYNDSYPGDIAPSPPRLHFIDSDNERNLTQAECLEERLRD